MDEKEQKRKKSSIKNIEKYTRKISENETYIEKLIKEKKQCEQALKEISVKYQYQNDKLEKTKEQIEYENDLENINNEIADISKKHRNHKIQLKRNQTILSKLNEKDIEDSEALVDELLKKNHSILEEEPEIEEENPKESNQLIKRNVFDKIKGFFKTLSDKFSKNFEKIDLVDNNKEEPVSNKTKRKDFLAWLDPLTKNFVVEDEEKEDTSSKTKDPEEEEREN